MQGRTGRPDGESRTDFFGKVNQMAEFKPQKAKHVYQLTFEGNWPSAVTFLDSSRRLVAANRDGEMFLWDLPESPPEPADKDDKDKKDKDNQGVNVAPVRQLVGHANGVTRLIPIDGGKSIISASLDRSIRIWDLTAAPGSKAEVVLDRKTREKKARRDKEALSAPGVEVDIQDASQKLAGHSDWVLALGISGNQQRMISGDGKGQVIVWDLAARKQITTWQGHPLDWISSAALSPDGEVAFVGEYSHSRGSFDRPPAQARFFKASDGTELVDVLKVMFPKVKERDNSYGYAQTWGKFIGKGLVAADFSPDGKLLAAAQGGEIGTGKAHLLEVETGKLVRSISEHQKGTTDVRFSPDGKYVLTTGRDTTCRICQTEDGKEVLKLGKERGGQFKDWLSAVAISPDHQWIAATDIAGIVHLWQLEG